MLLLLLSAAVASGAAAAERCCCFRCCRCCCFMSLCMLMLFLSLTLAERHGCSFNERLTLVVPIKLRSIGHFFAQAQTQGQSRRWQRPRWCRSGALEGPVYAVLSADAATVVLTIDCCSQYFKQVIALHATIAYITTPPFAR